MEHLEAFGFQDLSNGDDAQMPAGFSASYPHSSSGSLLDPWTNLDTAGLSGHPSFQSSPSTTHFLEPSMDDAGLHPINPFSDGYPPILPFHTQIPSNSFALFGQLNHDTYLHYPIPAQPPGHLYYYPPPFSASRYAEHNPFSHSQVSSLTYIQHPSLQRPPNEQSAHFMAHSSLQAVASVPPMVLRQPSAYRQPNEQPYQHIPHREQRGGFLHGARNVVIKNAVMNDNSNSDSFMSELLKQTIRGAAFDSSDRNPPPRCHPGTRMTIVDRVQQFIANRNGGKRMFWIVGPAGVGKSAIMQTIAENVSVATANEVVLGASIFFSITGCSDGTKAIITLAYQLAANYTPYRDFIQAELIKDPALLDMTMIAQFNRLIVEPFVRRSLNIRHGHFLIVVDGLDECERQDTQCELLGLISYFCITYPTSPLVWIVASRPEPHITSFFSRPKVTPAYEKEEIRVDEDEAREDVELFLHVELRKIQMESFALRDLPRWPTEHDFLKLADASSGLFACASTIVKYINDPAYANPASQLCEVLDVIDSNSRHHVEGKPHPMAHLDTLYTRILSRVPADVMDDTRKLLLIVMSNMFCYSLCLMCNWIGMTKDTAYSATYHLRSVLHVPAPDEATAYHLLAHHKSFIDYLRNSQRSNFCLDIEHAFDQLSALCARRVLEEAPNGVLQHDPGTYADISLSWPCQEQSESDDRRFKVYQLSVWQIMWGFKFNYQVFQNPFFIHALTAFDTDESALAHNNQFIDCLLDDESRHSTFMEHKVLKQIQVRTLDPRNISKHAKINYRFQCPAAIMDQVSNPWDPLCEHKRYGSYEEGQDQDWKTNLFLAKPCSCSTRFWQHLEIGKTRSPDDLVTVFINFKLSGYVEYQFVDPGGSMAQWTYTFPYEFPSHTGMQSSSISGTSEQCDMCSK